MAILLNLVKSIHFFICPNYNQLAKCSHKVHMKPGLVEMSAKLKKIEFAGKVKTDQRVKR